MVRLTVVIVALAAFGGCGSKNPASCPSGAQCPDGGMVCKQNSDCADPNLPACDTDTQTCAQCFGSSHDRCTGMTPRCEADTCVACVDDGDCGAAGVCLPSGACADASSVIHAAPAGSSMPGCGDASNACTLEQALASATAGKTVIKLDAGTYTPAAANFAVDADVTIDARAATLHAKVDGPLLDIRAGRTVSLLGGTLEGATNGDGIVCNANVTLTVSDTILRMMDKSAINAVSGCNLTVTHASISNTSLKANQFPAILDNGDSLSLARSSLVSNHGGGVTVNSGTFAIVGNVVLNNGTFNAADGSGSPTGGIAISTTVNASNRLAFNTVVGNLIQTSSKSAGIHCDAGASIVGSYNIVWDNNPMAQGAQVTGICKHTYSDVGPAVLASAIDAGHALNLNPQLVNEQTDPHLKAQSALRGYAPSDADLTGLAARDIDGDARTAPADLGADQVRGP